MSLLNKDEYVQGILEGNTVVLSRAITLLESTKNSHTDLAREILEDVLPYTGKSKRIGITGVPGVGKSTLIEQVGLALIKNKENKLAVLAIDPTSQLSKGSILGDKTRMEEISGKKNVYIRPTAAGKTLGGVSRKTHETLLLCEAAGYNYIVIETVGVGQSEIAVHAMVDCFLLLALPGAGDELQGIKRGIMEMADIIAVNKSYEDDKFKPAAKKARQEIQNALHYFPTKENSWITKVLQIDALHNKNIDNLIDTITSFFNYQDLKNHFIKRRQAQNAYWLEETVNRALLDAFYSNPSNIAQLKKLKEEVIQGKLTAYKAAEMLLKSH